MKYIPALRKLNQRGVTLVEMILAMGLMAILLTLLLTIFTSVVDTQAQTDTYSSVLVEGRFVITRLNEDIGRATAVSTPSALGGTASSLVLTIGGNNYTYALSGTTLQLTDSTGADKLTGNDVTVSSLSFKRLGNSGGKDSIQYSFTLTSVSQTHGGTNVQTFSSTMERR